QAGGRILLVHSSVNGARATVDRLAAGGLEADVVARHPGPLGPLMASRAGALPAPPSVTGARATVERLAAGGLEADVVARHPGPLGPLMASRAAALEARGLLRPGQLDEEVVVVRARR